MIYWMPFEQILIAGAAQESMNILLENNNLCNLFSSNVLFSLQSSTIMCVLLSCKLLLLLFLAKDHKLFLWDDIWYHAKENFPFNN